MTDKLRIAFEVFMKEISANIDFNWIDGARYSSFETQGYWIGYQVCNAWRDSLLDSEAMVEKVAIAICPWYDYRKGKTPPESRWAALLPEAKQAYLDQAIAALKAMKGDK